MNSTYTAPRRLIKTPDEIEKMRIAGRLAAEVLEMIKPYIKAGVSTSNLIRFAVIILKMYNTLFQPA